MQDRFFFFFFPLRQNQYRPKFPFHPKLAGIDRNGRNTPKQAGIWPEVEWVVVLFRIAHRHEKFQPERNEINNIGLVSWKAERFMSTFFFFFFEPWFLTFLSVHCSLSKISCIQMDPKSIITEGLGAKPFLEEELNQVAIQWSWTMGRKHVSSSNFWGKICYFICSKLFGLYFILRCLKIKSSLKNQTPLFY